MKRVTPGLALVLVLAAGCATNLRDQAVQYDVSLTAAVESLSDLREQGIIDDAAYKRFDPLVQEAYAARTRLKAAAEAGDEASVRLYAELVKESVKALLKAQIEAQAATKGVP